MLVTEVSVLAVGWVDGSDSIDANCGSSVVIVVASSSVESGFSSIGVDAVVEVGWLKTGATVSDEAWNAAAMIASSQPACCS